MELLGRLFLVLAVCGSTLLAAPPKIESAQPSYRNDYTYLPEQGVFVKVNTRPRSWAYARAYCEWEGGDLAVIKSPGEARAIGELLQKQIPKFEGAWVGAHDIFLKGEFLTIFGDPLYEPFFDEWTPNETDPNVGDKDCVTIVKENGLLNVANCHLKLPFVCRRESNTIVPNPDCENFDPAYKVGVDVDGSCFKLHTHPKIWGEALQVCYAEQSRLAIINSVEEAKLYVDELAKHPNNTIPSRFDKDVALLGFHDRFLHGEFLTVDGKYLVDSGYDVEVQEVNQSNMAHCGGITRSGVLLDVPCDVKYLFLCERKLSGPPEVEVGLFSRFGEDD